MKKGIIFVAFMLASISMGAQTTLKAQSIYDVNQDDHVWYYLINGRTNASSLYKYGVTVTNNGTSYENCLIIAPDDFTGTLQSTYTLDEVNNLGLVCLPAAGFRNGSSFENAVNYGYYWSATPRSNYPEDAYFLYLDSSAIALNFSNYRDEGSSLRLVRKLMTDI